MASSPLPFHARCWISDTVPDTSSSLPPEEDFVEVTLDLQDDDTIVLHSVEPTTIINLDLDGAESIGVPVSASAMVPRSPAIRRSSSHKLRQFSQELKVEAAAKARYFPHELKAELRRFSWSHVPST